MSTENVDGTAAAASTMEDDQMPELVSTSSDNADSKQQDAEGEKEDAPEDVPKRNVEEVLAEKLASATEMKQEGNTMFKAKTFDAAIAKYSQALACLSEIRDEDEADSDDEDEFEFDGHPDVKALQISLYLNLSMTYMKQNRWNETISSCSVVLKEDEANAKALYRRGVSHARKTGWQAAKKDLLAAYKIDPNNKEIRKELAAVKKVLVDAKEKRKDSMSKGFGGIYGDKEKEEKERKRKEAEKLKRQRERWEAENAKRENLGYNPMQFSEFQEQEEAEAKAKKEAEEKKEKEQQEERRQRREAERQSNSNNDKEETDEYDDEDLQIMNETKKMGYCHFNRKLSDRENNLIGSIAPKQVAHTAGEPSKKEQSHSQWNEAGTWEEKDTTKWCEGKLKEMLVGAQGTAGGLGDMDGLSELTKGLDTDLSSQDGMSKMGDLMAKMSPISVKTTKVSTIEGESNMAVVRKTKRYIYDFNAEVEWEANVDSALPGVETEGPKAKRYKGTVKIPELTSSLSVDQWDFNLSYKGTIEGGHKKQLQKALAAMVENLKEKIAHFVSEYEAAH